MCAGTRRQVVRVQEQVALEAQEPVEERAQKSDAEDERDLPVALPRLLLEAVDADGPVEAALDRAEPAEAAARREVVVV